MKLITRVHKVKKGETPERIARKYGHPDLKKIWTHPKNKAVKSKRKTPDSVYIGDELFIPITDKERKDIFATITILDSLRLSEVEFCLGMGRMHVVATVTENSIKHNKRRLTDIFKASEDYLLVKAKHTRKIENEGELSRLFNTVTKYGGLIESKCVGAVNAVRNELTWDEKSVAGKPGNGNEKIVNLAAKTLKDAKSEILKGLYSVEDVVLLAVGIFNRTDFTDFSRMKSIDVGNARSTLERELLEKAKKIRKYRQDLSKRLLRVELEMKIAALAATSNIKACEKRIRDLDKQLKDHPTLKELKQM